MTANPTLPHPLMRTDIVRWHQGLLANTLKVMAVEDVLEAELARGLEALWRVPLPPLPLVHWRRDRPEGAARCMLLAGDNAAVLVWQARIAHDGLARWQVEVVLAENGQPVDGEQTRHLLAQVLDTMTAAFGQIPAGRRDKAFEQAGAAALLRGPCWSLLSGKVTGADLLPIESLCVPPLR